MTPEQWRKLQELFDEVTQAPPPERETALERVEATVEDPSLLEELRRLVKHAEPDPGFLRPIPGMLSGSTIHPGDLVGGRFEILRSIGRGGMGQVFEAVDRKLDERVAIKVIAPEFARDAGLLERFLREVQIARRISHPNICRIHDLGEHGGVPYLSMELLEGETLAKRLEQGPLPLDEWESLAGQLFDGLRAAHAVGVIHRDLKPSNLMLVGSRLVILDFGLARPVLTREDSSLTRTGTLIGTLDWMAPEQLLGEFDERSDLYSAALILLQALKGKTSEKESGGLAAALRRATGDTDFRKLLPANMGAPWRYVILRCLERDPARRPARAQDVQEIQMRRRSVLFANLGNFARNRWIRVSAATLILLALLVLSFRYLWHPGLQPGSLIMVAQTNNATSEADLGGIASLLRADLEQSSQFNVWDNQRVGDALRSMRLDPQSQPNPKEWREIAAREKAPLLVFSTLSRLSDGYSLAIQTEEIGSVPEPAVNHWEHTFSARSRTSLFDAVHEAAQWIRSKAGENPAGLSAHNRPAQDITTNNWEALQLYGQADSLSAAQRSTDAIPVLERALQIDAQFAMAHMRLGDILNAQSRSEEGFGHWRQAIDLAAAQHLSDHESLNIESRYHFEIKDFKAAQPVLLEWTKNFPHDSLAAQLLASCLYSLGRNDEAISQARYAQDKFGPTVFGTSTLIRAFAAKNQPEDVEQAIQILDKLSVPELAMQFRGINAALRGDNDTAERIFRQLASKAVGTESSRAVRMLANLQADLGRVDEASNTLRDAISRDQHAGEDGLASQKAVAFAFLEGVNGRRQSARAWAAHAVSVVGPSPQVILEAVTVLARNGDAAGAARLAKQFPEGKGPRFEAARLRMEGEISSSRGDFEKAVELLDKASRIDRPEIPKEYLARALDLAGHRERAEFIYRSIADTPWVIWSTPESGWPGTRYFARQYLLKAKGE